MAETLPDHLFSTVICSFCFSQCLGNLIASLSGYILPDDDEYQKLKDTDAWLIIYIYFPAGVQVLMLVFLLTIVRYEPIKFLIV